MRVGETASSFWRRSLGVRFERRKDWWSRLLTIIVRLWCALAPRYYSCDTVESIGVRWKADRIEGMVYKQKRWKYGRDGCRKYFIWSIDLQQAEYDERHHAQTDSQDDGHVAGFEGAVFCHVGLS